MRTEDMPPIQRWLHSISTDNRRSAEFFPWTPTDRGPEGVRCVLKVSRGTTVVSGKRPYEERTAEGTGKTMEEAFQKAYDELVGWLT